MGTWDIGPFDNDPAKEIAESLLNGSFRMDQLRFECDRGELSAEQGEAIIAIAAIMNGAAPEGMTSDQLAYPFTGEDRWWARERVAQVLKREGSALYEQWEDRGEVEQWLGAVNSALLSRRVS